MGVIGWLTVIVSILAVLTTVLIGFQIANYIMLEKKINKKVNRVKAELRQFYYDELCQTNIDNAQLDKLDYFYGPEKLLPFLVMASNHINRVSSDVAIQLFETVKDWAEKDKFKDLKENFLEKLLGNIKSYDKQNKKYVKQSIEDIEKAIDSNRQDNRKGTNTLT